MDKLIEQDLFFTRNEIDKLRKEVKLLHSMIGAKEVKLRELEEFEQTMCPKVVTPKVNELTNEDIERYSRQLILPNFGVDGQMKLKAASVLIVGLGGLGCPAAQYLAAAGCGCIGVVDYDNVDRSNLHRQVLHSTARCNYSKVESAKLAINELNPHCTVEKYYTVLDNGNALELFAKYDLILDCSDNVATRYLLNDACVMLHKPLVSGSALQLDGQVTVYNYGDQCPCYRCLFPVPPPPETVTNCGDGGILGAVTGVIGSMQALEAIKIIVGLGNVLAGRLLIFDALESSFRSIKLRGRRRDCDICSEKPIITHLLDYEHYCGSRASDKHFRLSLLQDNQRCHVRDYNAMRKKPHLLIDVRSSIEFDICRLPEAVNVPLQQILDDSYLKQFPKELEDKDFEVIVVCRRGNDSQIATQHMLNKFPGNKIRDLKGGLYAWQKHIDQDFPIY